jgi:VIT1/CCC1 family predicted Fe2+/Mn2+ transporter
MKGLKQNCEGYNRPFTPAAQCPLPPPSEETELGDEPTQLRRIADATEAHLRRVQEEKEQATVALKQAQEEVIEQCRVAQQEKDDLQTKFEEERAQIQQEKEQLLAEQIGVKEAVNRALRSVTGLEKKEEDPVEHQVAKLAEAIQQLQQRIADLELQTVPSTLQDVRDQREATARSAVERIKALALECKQLSSRSVQTYE